MDSLFFLGAMVAIVVVVVWTVMKDASPDNDEQVHNPLASNNVRPREKSRFLTRRNRAGY